MLSLDDAQLTFLTAAAKVYAALKIANPAGTYATSLVVPLNIDGGVYQCRCDCTGVIQCIIRVMGYDPNWPSPGWHGGGDGLYLTQATESFVKDKNGNISPDWVVLPFDPNDAKPGDIRAARSHSHADIFVDYKNGYAYGLNAGSGPNTNGRAIPLSCDAGVKYMQDNDPNDLAATWTIQNDDAAKVLRFVNGAGVGGASISGTSQTLRSLDVQLAFVRKISFQYLMQSQTGNYSQVNPGFFPLNACYPTDDGEPATDSYSDDWLEFIPDYTATYVTNDTEWINAIQDGIIMLYTLDNSDPLLYGRTIFLKEDGTNDYDASRGYVPVIRTQFPVHFRCVLTDYATRSKDYGRSSAYFTNQSAEDCNQSVNALVKAFRNSMFMTDAVDKSLESPDKRGYLAINDRMPYERSEYEDWVKGVDADA